MTVGRLIKELERLKAKYGNIRVGVNKAELWDGNGTFDICDITVTCVEWVPLVDGDGHQEYTQKGEERGGARVVLS